MWLWYRLVYCKLSWSKWNKKRNIFLDFNPYQHWIPLCYQLVGVRFMELKITPTYDSPHPISKFPILITDITEVSSFHVWRLDALDVCSPVIPQKMASNIDIYLLCSTHFLNYSIIECYNTPAASLQNCSRQSIQRSHSMCSFAWIYICGTSPTDTILKLIRVSSRNISCPWSLYWTVLLWKPFNSFEKLPQKLTW